MSTDGNPRRPATIPAMVIIRVTDVNDNPPMFINDPFDFTVRENLPENSPVGQVGHFHFVIPELPTLDVGKINHLTIK